MISICRYRILFKTWWFYLLWGERRYACTQHHSVHTKYFQLESSWAYCYSASQNPQLFWLVSSSFTIHFCNGIYFSIVYTWNSDKSICSQLICFLFVQTASQSAKLNFRIPSWTSADGAGATLNDKDLGSLSPGKIIPLCLIFKLSLIF